MGGRDDVKKALDQLKCELEAIIAETTAPVQVKTSHKTGMRANPPSGDKLLLTVDEAAHVIGQSRSTTYLLIKAGYIRTTLIGSSRRVHRNECIKFAKYAASHVIDLPPRQKK